MPGGTHIRKFGISGCAGNQARGEQGVFGLCRLERTVGVPELIAERGVSAAGVAGSGFAVFIEVKDIVDVDAEAEFLRHWEVNGGVFFAGPKYCE